MSSRTQYSSAKFSRVGNYVYVLNLVPTSVCVHTPVLAAENPEHGSDYRCVCHCVTSMITMVYIQIYTAVDYLSSCYTVASSELCSSHQHASAVRSPDGPDHGTEQIRD